MSQIRQSYCSWEGSVYNWQGVQLETNGPYLIGQEYTEEGELKKEKSFNSIKGNQDKNKMLEGQGDWTC